MSFAVHSVNAETDMEFVTKLGASIASVTKPESATTKKSVIIAGIPFGLGLSFPINHNYSLELSYKLLMDFPNQQISAQSAEVISQFHIAGGPRRYVIVSKNNQQIFTSTTQTSLLFSVASTHYSASTGNFGNTIVGGMIEFRTGLYYRINRKGIQLSATIISFSSSEEQLTGQNAEIVFFYLI